MERLIVDRYELVEELAVGGMATVYLGRVRGAVGFSRTVAIKRPHKQYTGDPGFAAMIRDEARLASRIRHPNVVPTLDVVSHGGELLLVMEYVHGESLAVARRAAADAGTPIPIPVAASIVHGMLLGLHAAHEAKDERGESLDVVHRDVSPQNVLVGVDGIARVVDFGIAKAVGRLQETTTGRVKGKAAYMAPEQLRGSADRRTDVYATSVVLWELLTGKRLYTGESYDHVLANVLAGNAPSPRAIAPRVSEALDEIVMCGLDPNPDLRFATAREMARALERAAPIASAFEVAAWLEETVGASLKARAEQVARVEQEVEDAAPRAVAAADVATGITAGPSTIPPREVTKRKGGAIAVLVLAVVAASVAIAGIRLASRPPVAADAVPAPSVVASPSVLAPSVAPSAPAPPAPSEVAASPSAPPSMSARPKAVPSTAHAPPPTTSAKPARPSCNPPYVIEADGHKHFLLECL
jgi:serine/threonine-protein kinase